MTWNPSDATSLTIFSHYQKQEAVTDYQALPYIGTVVPGPGGRRIPVSRFSGEPGWDGSLAESMTTGVVIMLSPDGEQYKVGFWRHRG